MPLSRLTGVSNFCSNSPLSFILIVRILSSQAISFQTLLYAPFPRFPWLVFVPFPSYFNFHNLIHLGIDVFMHDMTIPPQTALKYHIFNLHNNTCPITKNHSITLSTCLTPHIILIIYEIFHFKTCSTDKDV